MDRNDLLNATRDALLAAYSGALEKSVADAAVAVGARDDEGAEERKRAQDVRTILRSQGEQLRRQVLQNMEQLLERSFKTTYSAYRPTIATSLTADSLSLVESSALEDELRVNEITHRFRNLAEDELRDLNCRIAVIFEQDDIKERENPFRPYLFTRSLMMAVDGLGRTPAISALLARQLADGLTPRIPELYAGINGFLAEQGISAQLALRIQRSAHVSAAGAVMKGLAGGGQGGFGSVGGSGGGGGYPAAQSGTQGGSGHGGAAPPPQQRVARLLDSVRGMASGFAHIEGAPLLPGHETAPAQPQGWLGAQEAPADILRKFFSGDGAAPPAAPAAGRPFSPRAALARSAPAAPEHGGGMTFTAPAGGGFPSIGMAREPDAATADVAPAAGGELRNLVMEHRERLAHSTADPAQHMVIDVIAMLFEFILRDPLVPLAVRAQLGRLQFLLLQVASRDHALLTQRDHPARLLVDRIGSIAVGWQHDDARGERVAAEISRVVDRLLEDDGATPQLFAAMLAELDTFIATLADSGAAGRVKLAIEAVELAQRRLQTLASTTMRLRAGLADLIVDPYLRDFLMTSWVRAIERAERSDAKRAQRFRTLVPDLLWSIVPKANEEDWAQLIAILPAIVSTLREGIVLIGWNPAQQQTLMNWLVEVHTGVLRSGKQGGVAPSLASFHQHFAALLGAAGDSAPDVGNQEEREQYLRDALKELDVAVRLLDPVFAAGDKPASRSTDAERETIQVSVGAMLELPIDGTPQALRTVWIGNGDAGLILTADDTTPPALIGRRTLQKLLKDGRARLLETEPLFMRSVQALLASASQLDEAKHY